MVKEIEKYGIPIVHMATITTISESVGANRIVPTIAIPYPIGKPEMGEIEDSIRKPLVGNAVDSLSVEVSGPTLFK